MQLLLRVGLPVLDEWDRRHDLVEDGTDQKAAVVRHVVLPPKADVRACGTLVARTGPLTAPREAA